MNPEQLDDLVASHLQATAPRHAPATLVDSALARIWNTPQRDAGWRMGVVGIFAAAALVVLAVMVGMQLGGQDTGNTPSGDPSAAPIATVVASPSLIEPGLSDIPLLLRLTTVNEDTDPAPVLPAVTVTLDGTVVWRPLSTTGFAGYLTRRLTQEGLDQLKEVIFGGGLFADDVGHGREPLPGIDAPMRGGYVHMFVVLEGADEVRVQSAGWLGDEEEAMSYQPAPERRALDELAWQLRDPESLLGEEAWAGPVAVYEPDSYFLVVLPHADAQSSDVADVAALPLPLDGAVLTFEDASDGSPNIRCGVISRREAVTILETLIRLGVSGDDTARTDRATVASLDWADGNGTVDLWVLPRLLEVPECEGPF